MKTVDLVNFRISGSWSRFLTLQHPARSHPPKSITSHFLLSKKKVCVCDHRYDRLSPVACCRRITLPCLALSLVYISFFRRPRKTGTRQPRACGYRLLTRTRITRYVTTPPRRPACSLVVSVIELIIPSVRFDPSGDLRGFGSELELLFTLFSFFSFIGCFLSLSMGV